MERMRPESKRRLTAVSTLSVGLLLVLALFAIVNYFGWKYHQRFDWTGSELYTLSEKSENIVRGLDRDIEAVVFLSPADPLYDSVRELLARYEAASPRLTVRYVDAASPTVSMPVFNPMLAGTSDPDVVFEDEGLVFLRLDETADGADYNMDADMTDTAVLALLDGTDAAAVIQNTERAIPGPNGPFDACATAAPRKSFIAPSDAVTLPCSQKSPTAPVVNAAATAAHAQKLRCRIRRLLR